MVAPDSCEDTRYIRGTREMLYKLMDKVSSLITYHRQGMMLQARRVQNIPFNYLETIRGDHQVFIMKNKST